MNHHADNTKPAICIWCTIWSLSL